METQVRRHERKIELHGQACLHAQEQVSFKFSFQILWLVQAQIVEEENTAGLEKAISYSSFIHLSCLLNEKQIEGTVLQYLQGRDCYFFVITLWPVASEST